MSSEQNATAHGFPTAPLYTIEAAVPNESKYVVEKIDAGTAEATLNALDKAIDRIRSYQAKRLRHRADQDGHSSTSCIAKVSRWHILRDGLRVALYLVVVALTIASVVRLGQSSGSLSDCKDSDVAPEGWVFADPDDTSRVTYGSAAGRLTLDLTTVCRLRTGVDWKGAPRWRWLLFFALWPVLHWISYGIASLISAALLNIQFLSSAWLLPLMMEGPFVRVLRDGLWMASWLVLMADALNWARNSDEWTALAGAQAWTPAFREVHYYMLRALLAVLLFDVAALLRQTLMAYLVMRFRHKKFQFFASFQRALGQENSIKALFRAPAGAAGACRDGQSGSGCIKLESGSQVAVLGMQAAHWEAVQFLTMLAGGSKDGVLQNGRENAEEGAARLRLRAINLRTRFAELLADDINQGCAHKTRPQTGRARGGVEVESADPRMVKARPVERLTAADIERAASEAVAGLAIQPGTTQTGVTAVTQPPEEPPEEDWEEDPDEPSQTEMADAAQGATQAFEDVGGWEAPNLSWKAKVVNPTHKKVAQELASKRYQVTPRSWHLVGLLQNHILENPHMKVAWHGDSETKEAVDSPQSAWLLGYVLFFRLKRKADLVITEADVTDAEKASHVQKPYLWRLIDRDGGRFATLPELMEGSEELFHERQAFARMLTGNVSVVRQVETVLAVVLLIVWVFIAAWIFDPGAVQRTWTALSAGLLSFSFIFSSTIRELFENAIFLFAVQPFHPRDTIIYNTERYTIIQVTLLSIKLRRLDGAVITVATSALRTKQVHNISRSGKLQEKLQFSISLRTPREKLGGIAHYVKACIQQHPMLFDGTYVVWWSAASGENLQLSITFVHRTNGLRLLQTQIAKTHMYNAVARAFVELDITCAANLNLSFDGGGGAQAPTDGAELEASAEDAEVMRAVAGAGLMENL